VTSISMTDCGVMRLLICWHIEMTLLRTLRYSEPSFSSIGGRYVDSIVCNFDSESANAILSSTLSSKDSSLASGVALTAMYRARPSLKGHNTSIETLLGNYCSTVLIDSTEQTFTFALNTRVRHRLMP